MSRKFTHVRDHPLLVYFGVFKRLGWAEATGETEASSMQDNYSLTPSRTYYRLTEEGKGAGDEFWSNLLFTLHPEIGASQIKTSD